MSMFKQAQRQGLKARIALCGPAGSGKTYTALRLGFALVGPNGRIAVIDTENRSASKYVGLSPDGTPWLFDVCELEHFDPGNYVYAARSAYQAGYDLLIIDGISQAWDGVGGALDQIDKSSDKNKFGAWRDVTPKHRELVNTMLSAPCHLFVTMRTKTEYVIDKDEKGKTIIQKLGLKPVQREGVDYEFDIVCDLDTSHNLTVTKSRCSEIDGVHITKPGPSFVVPIARWLNLPGAPAAPAQQPPQFQAAAQQPQPPAANGHAPQANGQQPQAQFDASDVNENDLANRNDFTATMNLPCGEGSFQEQRIKELFQELQIPIEDAKAIVQKRGANRICELKVADADELVRRLESMVTKRDLPWGETVEQKAEQASAEQAQQPESPAAKPEKAATPVGPDGNPVPF